MLGTTKYPLFLFALLLLSCGERKAHVQKEAGTALSVETPKDAWVPLFNGKDLEGWTMKIKGHPLGENFGNTFRVEDGILSVRYDAYGDDFNDRFGALYFDRKLANYRLKVEYRFVGDTAPGAPEWGYRDSGVQFHGQSPSTLGPDQPFPVCLEYNLHGGNGTDDRPVGAICANGMFVEVNGERNTSYCTPAAVARTFHGDQWVTLEIDVNKGRIVHFVNGEEILRYAEPAYDPEHDIAKTLLENKGDTAVREGYISLQSNSHPIDFRKIELMAY